MGSGSHPGKRRLLLVLVVLGQTPYLPPGLRPSVPVEWLGRAAMRPLMVGTFSDKGSMRASGATWLGSDGTADPTDTGTTQEGLECSVSERVGAFGIPHYT